MVLMVFPELMDYLEQLCIPEAFTCRLLAALEQAVGRELVAVAVAVVDLLAASHSIAF